MSKKSDDDSNKSFSENEETTDDSVWTVVDRQKNLNLQFERNSQCRFCGGESVSIQEVIERAEISHTKPEPNATKCIRMNSYALTNTSLMKY